MNIKNSLNEQLNEFDLICKSILDSYNDIKTDIDDCLQSMNHINNKVNNYELQKQELKQVRRIIILFRVILMFNS